MGDTTGSTFKLKPFTPAKVKADIIWIGALIAVFGAGVPAGISEVLVGGASLIALGINAAETFAEAHIHVGAKVAAEIEAARRELTATLPAVNQLVASLPGEVGAKVRQELELIEHGPKKAAAVHRGADK